jgi:hypothetical protein
MISTFSQIAEHHARHGFLILGPRRRQSIANLHDCDTNVYMWLNWRDIPNPETGAAEVYAHEVIKRLTQRGYEMRLSSLQGLGDVN